MAKRLNIKVAFNLDQLNVRDFLGRGQHEGELPAKLKWNTGSHRYCVPNEYIAGTIGRFLGIPIPPFGIVRSDEKHFGSQPIFASLNFNWDKKHLLGVLPRPCWEHLPDLCTGCLLFDVWIANCDRYDANLAVDSTFTPKHMQFFDHDASLFGKEGEGRLAAVKDSLGITEKFPDEGCRHLFLDEIDSQGHINKWLARINSTPSGFIRQTCDESVPLGLTKAEAKSVAAFLIERQRNIAAILNRSCSEFVRIPKWVLVA